MSKLDHMSDDELLRELFRRSVRVHYADQLLNVNWDNEGARSLSHEMRESGNEARDVVLSRMQNRSASHPWDGYGPRRPCLLLTKFEDKREPRWERFDWQDADVDCSPGYVREDDMSALCDSDHFSKTYGQYMPSYNFEILQWADLPSETVARAPALKRLASVLDAMSSLNLNDAPHHLQEDIAHLMNQAHAVLSDLKEGT